MTEIRSKSPQNNTFFDSIKDKFGLVYDDDFPFFDLKIDDLKKVVATDLAVTSDMHVKLVRDGSSPLVKLVASKDFELLFSEQLSQIEKQFFAIVDDMWILPRLGKQLGIKIFDDKLLNSIMLSAKYEADIQSSVLYLNRQKENIQNHVQSLATSLSVEIYQEYFGDLDRHFIRDFLTSIAMRSWIFGAELIPHQSQSTNNNAPFNAILDHSSTGIGVYHDRDINAGLVLKGEKTFENSQYSTIIYAKSEREKHVAAYNYGDYSPNLSMRRAQAALLLRNSKSLLNYNIVIAAIDKAEPLIPVIKSLFGDMPTSVAKAFLTSFNKMPHETLDPSSTGFYRGRTVKDRAEFTAIYRLSGCEWAGLPNLKNSDNDEVKLDHKWKTLAETFQTACSIVDAKAKTFFNMAANTKLREKSSDFSDALNSIMDNLFIPLLPDEYANQGNMIYSNSLLANDRIAANLIPLDKKLGLYYKDSSYLKRYHELVANSIYGNRSMPRMIQASDLFHRRIASLEALKHEKSIQYLKKKGFDIDVDFGWLAITKPWVHPFSGYSVTPLTSAGELVEEGEAMDHCVGGYYNKCRTGQTQILSIKNEQGRHIATVELAVSFDVNDKKVSLRVDVIQFKGFRNRPPNDDLANSALRTYLRELRGGSLAVDLKGLYSLQSIKSRDTHNHVPSREEKIESARAIYQFYKVLLPHDAPDDYDSWAEKTGLLDFFREVHDVQNVLLNKGLAGSPTQLEPSSNPDMEDDYDDQYTYPS